MLLAVNGQSVVGKAETFGQLLIPIGLFACCVAHVNEIGALGSYFSPKGYGLFYGLRGGNSRGERATR